MANATLIVRFAGPEGVAGHLSAEVDSRPDGLNDGQSSFAPGANVAILVWRTENVTITRTECSAGSLSTSDRIVVDLTEDVVFADAQEARLSRPALATPVVTWVGRSLGAVTLMADQMTLRAQSPGVAVARVSYQAHADVLWLQSPSSIDGATDFQIAVLVAGAVI